MKLDQKYNIFPHTLSRDLDDKTIILDMSEGVYYGLDDVGVRIWQLMSQGLRLTDICDTLLNEYDVTRRELEGDIIKLVDELLARKLIEPA